MFGAHVLGDNYVVKHRHALPQADILKGTGNAHLGNMIRCRGQSMVGRIHGGVFPFVQLRHLSPGMVADIRLVVKQHLAVGRLVNPGDDVEGRGLPGAVGADEGHNLPFVHLQGEVIDRHHTAKLHGDVFHLQNVVTLTHGVHPPFPGGRQLGPLWPPFVHVSSGLCR